MGVRFQLNSNENIEQNWILVLIFIKKIFVQFNLTEEFPFLVTKMSPYYDR